MPMQIAAGDRAGHCSIPRGIHRKSLGHQSRYVINKSGILDPSAWFRRSRNDRMTSRRSCAKWPSRRPREALAGAGHWMPEDIDAVLCAASNMQRAYPAMAVEIQAATGRRGYAFDMNVACSSATFGLQQARDAIVAGSARNVLVVNPEICTGPPQLPGSGLALYLRRRVHRDGHQ
jgi:beta-ketodecanoyl-[acyl-carrier-protein] synthase